MRSPKFIIHLLFCSLINPNDGQDNLTDITKPGVKGRSAVFYSVFVIDYSGIFSPDYGFLTRIAYVESTFGENGQTFREGYFGGIWQVDEIGFKDTQDISSHPNLQSRFEIIKSIFVIDWKDVKWEDLTRPLYSALAARLFLSSIPEEIPSTLSGQAEYWKKYYNTAAGKGSAQDFIDRVNQWNSNSPEDMI